MTDSTTPEAPELAEAPPSRAGRNLPVATAVGLGLLALVIASLVWRDEAFLVLAALATCAAVWELAHAFTRRDLHVPLVPLLVGSVGILVSAYYAGAEAQLVSLMLTVGGIVIWRIVEGNGPGALRDCVAGAFAAVYLPFLAGFVVLMLDAPLGERRVLLFILLVVASDVGGYTAGVLLGRHPMAPRVSPKKTWEGTVGGWIGGVLATMLLGAWLVELPWLHGLALGAIVATLAPFGDLSKSMVKRQMGVKDFSALIPGHGGMFDRIDSLLFVAPVVYYYATLVPF